MAKQRPSREVPPQKTVLVDHFGVGDRWGWENEPGDPYGSGKPVSEHVDSQSSYQAIRYPTSHGRPTNE
jgi:hypothetical protein